VRSYNFSWRALICLFRTLGSVYALSHCLHWKGLFLSSCFTKTWDLRVLFSRNFWLQIEQTYSILSFSCIFFLWLVRFSLVEKSILQNSHLNPLTLVWIATKCSCNFLFSANDFSQALHWWFLIFYGHLWDAFWVLLIWQMFFHIFHIGVVSTFHAPLFYV